MSLRFSHKLAGTLALLSLMVAPVQAASFTPTSGGSGGSTSAGSSYGSNMVPSGSYNASQQTYQQMWHVANAGYGSSAVPGGYVYNPSNKVGANQTSAGTYNNKVGNGGSGTNQVPSGSNTTYTSNKLPNYGYGSSSVPGGYVYNPSNNKVGAGSTSSSNKLPNGGSSVGNQVPNGGSNTGNQVPNGGTGNVYSTSNLPNYGGGNYGSSAVPGGYVYNPGNKVSNGGTGTSSSNKLPNGGSSVSNQVPNGGSSVGNQVPNGGSNTSNQVPNGGTGNVYSTSNLPNYGGGNYGSSTVPGGYVYNPGNKVANGGSNSGSTSNKVPNGSSSDQGVNNKVANGGESSSVGNKVPNGSDGSSVNNKVPNNDDDQTVNNKVPNNDGQTVNNKVPNKDRDTDDDGKDDISLCNDRPYPKDIDGHWSEIYVRRLYDLCIIEGYGDGKFHPEQDVTRAELVKMALYSKGIDPVSNCYDADCGSPFTDLDTWQGQWIRKGWDLGIVQGYDHDTFKPNQAITRAEAVKVVLATYGYDPISTNDSFFDDVSGWSVGWVERAHEIGMVQGVGNGNFDPNRPITRAESAKIIAKMMEYWDTTIR